MADEKPSPEPGAEPEEGSPRATATPEAEGTPQPAGESASTSEAGTDPANRSVTVSTDATGDPDQKSAKVGTMTPKSHSSGTSPCFELRPATCNTGAQVTEDDAPGSHGLSTMCRVLRWICCTQPTDCPSKRQKILFEIARDKLTCDYMQDGQKLDDCTKKELVDVAVKLATWLDNIADDVEFEYIKERRRKCE